MEIMKMFMLQFDWKKIALSMAAMVLLKNRQNQECTLVRKAQRLDLESSEQIRNWSGATEGFDFFKVKDLDRFSIRNAVMVGLQKKFFFHIKIKLCSHIF